MGAHKTSMLQDLERGRRMEVDALIGAVAELGRVTGVATPNLDALHALVRLLDEQLAGALVTYEKPIAGYDHCSDSLSPIS